MKSYYRFFLLRNKKKISELSSLPPLIWSCGNSNNLAVIFFVKAVELHGPSMWVIAKIYGVHFIQSAFIGFEETSNYCSVQF